MGERDFGRVREEFEERGRGREQERVEKREKIEINTRECTFEWVNESELERERGKVHKRKTSKRIERE